MKVFPTTELKFELIDDSSKTINRLIRRTEISEKLLSQPTDKSFRGMIEGNTFRLISTETGKGALCVMSGVIHENSGHVNVEIHKVFKVLFSILLCLPIIAITIAIATGQEEAHPIFILVVILQILMIRFVFIGLAFKFLSKHSLNRLRDVLDVEWVKN